MVESVLRLIKDFLLPDSVERSGKDGVALTSKHKELLGKECFEILGELLALESDRGALSRVNMMCRRIASSSTLTLFIHDDMANFVDNGHIRILDLFVSFE